MGMGAAGGYVDEIYWESVEQLCKKTAQPFEKVLSKYGVSMGEAARALSDNDMDELKYPADEDEYGECFDKDLGDEPRASVFQDETGKFSNDDLDAAWKSIKDAYAALQREFAEVTKVGDSTLKLFMSHHSQGSRYDELAEGPYWEVDGMYELSPAGRGISSLVERHAFATYG